MLRICRLTLFFFAAASLAASAAGQTRKDVAPATAKPAVRDAVRTIEILGGDDMKYSLTRITAKRGEKLRIRLVSKGTLPKLAMAHNLVVLKPGTHVAKFIEAGAAFRQEDFIAPTMKASVLARTAFAGPGETVEVIFDVPQRAGTYPYVCTFSGHFAAGMTGTIVVK
jgi:azurin